MDKLKQLSSNNVVQNQVIKSDAQSYKKYTKMLYDTHTVNSMSSSSSYSPLNCKSSVNHKFRCVYMVWQLV